MQSLLKQPGYRLYSPDSPEARALLAEQGLGPADLDRALAYLERVEVTRVGTIVGIMAEGWDHTTFIQNIVILPLTFMGGVFYSVELLPSPWEELSHFNPIFYMLQAIRYGFLGYASDVPIGRVEFTNTTFAIFDDLHFSAVPAPGAGAVFGLLTLGALARRRR